MAEFVRDFLGDILDRLSEDHPDRAHIEALAKTNEEHLEIPVAL